MLVDECNCLLLPEAPNYEDGALMARIITHRFPIMEAVEAFRVADSARAGKVLFVWD